MADLTAWLDEREREAKAATPGPWAQNEPDELAHQVYKDHADGPSVLSYEGLALTNYRRDATHIAAWSPDTALRVLRALRAANKVIIDHDATTGGHIDPDELRAALNALPGAKP